MNSDTFGLFLSCHKFRSINYSLRCIDGSISNFLRDYLTCRLPKGECVLTEGIRTLFLDKFLQVDGVVFGLIT